MVIVLGLALFLRLVFLNQSLWLDESIQALALMGRMGPLLTYALADYQPPLYHLIGYVSTHIFGYSEIAIRLPSLLSGIFTVYFMVKIGELIGSKKIGLIAGLLAATNPLLIYYSQEGRTYAMTTLFVTASFYYFLELLKQKRRSHICSMYSSRSFSYGQVISLGLLCLHKEYTCCGKNVMTYYIYRLVLRSHSWPGFHHFYLPSV